MRWIPLAAALLVTSTLVAAQPPGRAVATVRFEVVSIKRSVSESAASSLGGRWGRWNAVNITPLRLVTSVYPFDTLRVVGAPGWMSSERYDIAAVTGGEANHAAIQAMLRTLLAERFNFAAHVETRTLQTYALVLAREDGHLGPRMKPFTSDCDALRTGQLRMQLQIQALEDLTKPRPCGMSLGLGRHRAFRFYQATGEGVADLVRVLMSQVERPVTDRTGLKGLFEIALYWNGDPSAPSTDPVLPSLFTAVQEQLGLKLDPRHEPAEVLVIDRIDRPAPD